MNRKQALEKAIEIAGSQEKLAGMTDYSQAAISQMLNRDGMASIKAAMKIEKSLMGKITRYQLRPDIFGTSSKQDHQ